MKKTLAIIFVFTTILFANPAFAITLPGRSIDVDQNSANIDYGTQNLNVNTSTGTNLNVNQGGREININTNTTTNGQTFNVTVNGQTVTLDSGKESLSVFVSKGGSLDSASADVLVSLQGNSVNMIKGDDDLAAYGNIVVSARPAVKGVSVENDRVIVKYNHPGKFLGLFKVHLGAQAVVDAEGNVSIKLPWYSFLVSKNSAEVKAAIEAGLKGDKSITVSAISDGSNSSVRVQNSAKVLNVMSSAVQGNQSISAQGNGNSAEINRSTNGSSFDLSNGNKSGSVNISR
jgi:hypothetical protein